MKIEKINYEGWPNSYRLSNNLIDLVVTTDMGPRIIRFGFVNRQNEFKEYADQIGKIGGQAWRIYGGHRLWHAPESIPRSYSPDNLPITLEEHPGFIRLIQPVEKDTGIQKEIDISLEPETASVRVIHQLRNLNLWQVELAPWAMTVMEVGGTAILPLPPRQPYEENVQPTNCMTLWAYTDMTDSRWTWGRGHVLLRQDVDRKSPQKIGLMAPDGWIAYARNNHLFVKRATYVTETAYPDYGCSLEVFTNGDMLEAETLGPLTRLEPQGEVEHREDWYLFDGVATPQNDNDVINNILPKIALTRFGTGPK